MGEDLIKEKVSMEFDLLQQIQFYVFKKQLSQGDNIFYVVIVLLMTDQLQVNGYFYTLIM